MKLERLADYILGFGDKHTSKEIPLADSLRPKVNFKKAKKQKITSADLEDKELTIVAAYHQYQKQLQGKEKEGKRGIDPGNRQTLPACQQGRHNDACTD